jgi:mannose-1-phosphate guanylyltransferase
LRAFLLAAGLGTRLRPITDGIPKCLVPICGKPLLQIWLEHFRFHGIEEVLVNTHHHSEKVLEFSRNWSGAPGLRLAHEDVLLGSAGTLSENWDFAAGEESFFVCYADNLTDVDLTGLLRFHQSHRGLVTMTLFRAQRPGECGIAEMDEHGLICGFEEKPVVPKSSLANAGIYIMRKDIRLRLPHRRPSDIGYDVLPACVGEMYGWLWEGMMIDIGNPESYALASEVWAGRQGPVAGSEREA